MDLFRCEDRMDPKEIEALAGLRPLFDPVFDHLLEGAIKGVVPVFYAQVTPSLITPFDPDYMPSKHPSGEDAVQQVMAAWRQGQFQRCWVYEKAGRLILSDDYIVLEAVRRGQPDYMPCWILGKPVHVSTRNLQGPLPADEVARLLGFVDGIGASPQPKAAAPPEIPKPITSGSLHSPAKPRPAIAAVQARGSILGAMRMVAVGLASVLVVAVGLGLSIQVQDDLLPGYASVWVDDRARQYTSPPCLQAQPDNRFSRQVEYSETVRLRYGPEPECRDASGFDGPGKSLLVSFLEERGLLKISPSRWDPAGNWRY